MKLQTKLFYKKVLVGPFIFKYLEDDIMFNHDSLIVYRR